MNSDNFKYYKLENGYIFKHDVNTGEFYLLTKNGNWVEDIDFGSIYYDASSDYDEITFDEIDNPIKLKKKEDIKTFDSDGNLIEFDTSEILKKKR